MHRTPADPIAPDETLLARRVRDHADGAVVPIDAMAIAHAAAVAEPRRRFGRVLSATTIVGRLGLVAALGLLGVAAIGAVVLNGGGQTAVLVPTLAPSPTPATVAPTVTVAAPSAVPTVAPIQACAPADLAMRVVSWGGAAGQRIASLTLTNVGPSACTLPSVTQPQLVDGTGSILIDGTAVTFSPALTIAAGASLTSMAQDGNYCGPDPVAPVTVAIALPGGGRVVATPVSATDTAGLAPCMGSGSAAYVEMQPWQP